MTTTPETLSTVLERVAVAPHRLATILAAHPEALLAFDARRSIVGINEAAVRFFAHDRHELDSFCTDALVPARFRLRDSPPPLGANELMTVELPALRGDGSEVMATWTFGAVSTPRGPLFVVRVRELARVRVETETLVYASVFEQTPVPLALTRLPDGILVALNPAFAELFEIDRDQALGRPGAELDIATQEERAEVTRLLEAQGAVRGLECERRTAKGKGLHLSLSVTRVRIAEVEHLLASVQDISRQRAHEASLARAVEQEQRARSAAEAASRAKDEFFATLSHELRTPLNGILGWASILLPKPRDEGKLDRGLDAIGRNARAQERLVNDLLDMSRIISGKLTLSTAPLSLSDVACAAADVVRPAADLKGVRLLVEVEPSLPTVLGDGARLQQVLWNLLSNAIRHTPPGGQVRLSGERVPGAVRLRVQDTGQGIAPEHLANIFERYRQLDSAATRVHTGLGLGLAIVRYLVDAHGGQVVAHSDGPGRGATFSVTLPALAGGEETPAPRA